MAKLSVADDEQDLARLAAERLTALIEAAILARGQALVSMTGGRTPLRLYALLADPSQAWRLRIDWRRLHLLWSDERHVAPDHPDSNYGTAKAALLDHVPIPPAQVHRMRGEMPDARDAAAEYEHTLQATFAASGRGDMTVDVALLGIGADAHIASIFPGSELLEGHSPHVGRRAGTRRVAAAWAAHLNAWRITLTPDAILDSRALTVLAAGFGKADAVHTAVEAPLDVRRAPAQLLRAAGDRVEWLLDRAAASRLTTG